MDTQAILLMVPTKLLHFRANLYSLASQAVGHFSNMV